MPLYHITPAAQNDLREIARYTEKQWGHAQTMIYGAALDGCFDWIVAGAAFSKVFSERFPLVRVTRCEHHYVFFLQPEHQPPSIIAVLHERMDMLQRLSDRLS